ncbi:MAG TPA: monofunctional biosynthetic peptidoglycan transglycosylase [Candidatus Binatia bacterium]
MKRVLLKSLLLSAIIVSLVHFYLALPNVSLLKTRNPRSSALMELRDQENREKKLRVSRQQIWVPYGRISNHLKKAVLLSEDASFFSHNGVDLDELKESLKRDLTTFSFKRGGSTITMQLARNLFLNPAKNPLRKIKEIIIAWQLEQALSKIRIFEIYLNVVEWGRNIYGAEAGSRHYFGKAAATLDPLEAATLVALLPNPRTTREKSILQRRNLVLARLAEVGHISKEEYDRVKQIPLFHTVKQEAPGLLQD